MNKGHIKVYRSLLDKGYYKDSEFVHLWIHLLLKANHKDNEWLYKGEIKKCLRGQLITSRKTLSEETGISESKIERILKVLKIEQQIEQLTTAGFRLLTIKNYNGYQKVDSISDSQWTASEQLVNTNKNDNNDNNINSNELIKETKVSRKKTEKEKEESRKIYEQNEQIRKFLLQIIGISDFTETQKMQRIYLNHIRNWANKEIQRLQEELGEQGRAEFQKLFLKRLDFLIKDSFKSKRVNSIVFIYSEIKAFNDSLLDNNTTNNIQSF